MHKVDNAIILAAGRSTRFVPISLDTSKGLLTVKGETLIERQIRQLQEIGINDITIVTGAFADQFDFLKTKYRVKTIFNKDYMQKNNFASLYAARDVLANSIISSCDLFFTKNIFPNCAEHAYYVSVYIEGKTKQRCLTLDQNDKIIQTTYGGENTWITFGGHAFFTQSISKKLIEKIRNIYPNPRFANKYWVDIQDSYLEEIPMYIKRIDKNDIIEFNTLDSLRAFDPNFTALFLSKTMHFICQKLQAKERDLEAFSPILQNNTPIGCSFTHQGKNYHYFLEQNQITLCDEFIKNV